MEQDFENILEIVGSYGKYQKLTVIFIIIPTSFFISLSVNTLIFQTVLPEKYWCNPLGRESTNYTQEEWWNLTLPRASDGNFEKCSQFSLEVENGTYISTNFESTTECSSEWEHEHILFDETVATSMGWLCEQEIYSTHILSVNMAGNAVGTFLLPIIADRFTGRRLMFYISCAIHLVFNAVILIFPVYGVFLVMRFLSGLSFQTNFQMPYIIGLELTCPDKRAFVSFCSFAAWTMGMCSTALVAWFIPHWWYLIIISCITSLLFFGYWKFLPESPRWLIAKGKIEECITILLQVASVNGKTTVDVAALRKELLCFGNPNEDSSLQDILNYRKALTNAILVMLLSITIFTAYGCTLVNVKILPNNYFLSFFVLSLSELPSNVMSYLSVHYLGRRFTSIITSILSIIFCFMATFFLENRVALLVVVCMIKVFVTQGIYVVYVITAEVFPTPVRSTGMGMVLVTGMIGIATSPYIVASSAQGPLQYWIMIGLCGAALLISFPLPETIGLPLPQTFHDANAIGKDRPYVRWIHFWNQHKYQPVPKKAVAVSNNNPAVN